MKTIIKADFKNLQNLLRVVNFEMSVHPQQFNSVYGIYSSRLAAIVDELEYYQPTTVLATIKSLYVGTDNPSILQAVEATNLYKYYINPDINTMIGDVLNDIDQLNIKIKTTTEEIKNTTEEIKNLITELSTSDVKQVFAELFDYLNKLEDETTTN